jgi:hypothetical protein
MIYVNIVREIENRLNFHVNFKAKMLEGLTIRKSGEFRLDGDKDLPLLTMIDLATTDEIGAATGTVTFFLKTSRKHDWARMQNDLPLGLIDWQELVQDALETRPSNLLPDQLLTAHDWDGALILDANGHQIPLLIEPYTWNCKMAEITDMSFTLQMDLAFKLVNSKRGLRRQTPISSA